MKKNRRKKALIAITCKAPRTVREEKCVERQSIKSIGKIKVRGISVSRFYNGKWQDGKRQYRFKGYQDNPIAILRDIYKRNGTYRKGMDRVLGQLYLYTEEKIEGFIL